MEIEIVEKEFEEREVQANGLRKRDSLRKQIVKYAKITERRIRS